MKQRKQILLMLLKLAMAALVLVVSISSSGSNGRIWMVSAQQQGGGGGIASSIIATILQNLQSRGFMTAATILALLPRSALNNIVPPMTLLIPTDASLANISSIPPTTYPNLLRYHILHGAFTFDQLKLLPVGTLIPTFLSPQNGVLVTANSGSQFALDGVPVATPNICPGVTGSSIACQGISSLLNPSLASGTPTFSAPVVSPAAAPGPAGTGAVPVPVPAPAPTPVPSPAAPTSSVPAPSPSILPPPPTPASGAPPPASPPSGVGLAGSPPTPASPPTAATSPPPPVSPTTTPAPPPPPGGAGSSSGGSRLKPMSLHWMVPPLVLLLLGAAALGDAQAHHR